MQDDRTALEIAQDWAQKEFQYHKARNNKRKMAAALLILESIQKEEVSPEQNMETMCLSCGSEIQEGIYCSECGQKLKDMEFD